MKNTNYNIRIQNLLISLEILNIHNTQYKTIYNNNMINYKYFNQNIYSLIFSIYNIRNNKHKYEFIKLILNKDQLLNKYIEKFKYLHKKKFRYYHITNLKEKLNLSNIAIINLYIIYKIINKDYMFYIYYYLLT